jgi:two-component sensor histidine kinase
MVSLALSLAPTPAAPGVARRCVGALASELDEATLAGAQLVVSELVTNSCRHAELATTDTIDVRLTTDAKGVKLAVSNPGSGALPKRRAPGADSGWGLNIVERLAARWGVRVNGGTTVWCELDRPQTRAS